MTSSKKEQPTWFSVQPAIANIAVEEDLILAFQIDQAKEVAEGNFRITFDPALLYFKRALRGTLLHGGNRTVR